MALGDSERRALASGGPRSVQVEVTSRCDLDCATCPRTFRRRRDGDLDPALLDAVLRDFPGLSEVKLHGLGEPLLHPRLADMVRACSARGAAAVLNTNGMRLDGATAEALVGAGCARVNVSVDGADEAAYGRMRPGGELGLVLANVRRLAEARRRAGSDRPAISLWMVGTTENVRSLPSLARLARVAGADEVYLQRLAFFGRGLATASASVHRSLGGRVLEVVREAAEACRLEGVRLSGSGRLDPGRLDEWAARAAEDWRDCERPWTGLYVAWDGTVHPCCVAPFVGRAPVLGRLPSERPREVWEGERLARFRARVAGARPPACCARCGTDWLL